jgi:aldose 1-epimerase
MTATTYAGERTTDHGKDIVRLYDGANGVEVLIAPGLGNRAYSMNVHGANILHMPAADISQLSGLSGIPFLAPWANRIPGGGFEANGNRYTFNESLGVLRMHPEHVAIHGMLTSSDLWHITGVGADSTCAWFTARLEFWRHPKLMANWPFAHEYEMTYRLAGGSLEVLVAVKNLSSEAMPVAIGFHPYFRIPGVPRSEWKAHIPARLTVAVDRFLCATGELTPNELPDPTPLSGHVLDTGFTDLVRENLHGIAEAATFWVEGGERRIEVTFGPKWQVGVVYAPSEHEFICFEPMAAITNGVNLAAEGKYTALQVIQPGGFWNESFHVRAVNFPV